MSRFNPSQYLEFQQRGINPIDHGADPTGTNDSTTIIQNAINALKSGQCLLISGTFKVSQLTFSNITNVTILAVGKGSGFISASVPSQTVNGVAVTIEISSCTGVVFEGLTLNGNGLGTGLIGIQNSTRIEIRRCTGYNTTGTNADGVYTINCNGNRYIDNHFYNLGGQGIISGNASSGLTDTNVTIQDNYVHNNGATGIAVAATIAKIIGNISTNNAGSGIVVASNTGVQSDDVVVMGNTCNYNTFHGIQSDCLGTSQTTRVKAIGNTCDYNTNAGIYADNTQKWTIANNHCNNNNQGKTTGVGIHLYNVQGAKVIGNYCNDTQATATQYIGIYFNPDTLTTDKDVDIVSNECMNNTYAGISLNASTGKADNVTVLGNHCDSNGTGGIFVQANFTNVKLSENTSLHHSSWDIRAANGTQTTGINNVAGALWSGTVIGHYTNGNYTGYGTAAPTTGTWKVGDRVYNTAPAASGTEGWICVTAGTPGTWKTFGSIGA